jgi:hypothetical protein
MKQLMLCFLILSFSMIIFSFDHTDHPQPVGAGKNAGSNNRQPAKSTHGIRIR